MFSFFSPDCNHISKMIKFLLPFFSCKIEKKYKIRLPVAIIEHIIDFTYDYTYEKNKKLVIQELYHPYHPSCGNICRYTKFYLVNGTLFRMMPLTRSTHQKCDKCENCVSSYSLNVCHNCAEQDENPIDFEYYHRICNGD